MFGHQIDFSFIKPEWEYSKDIDLSRAAKVKESLFKIARNVQKLTRRGLISDVRDGDLSVSGSYYVPYEIAIVSHAGFLETLLEVELGGSKFFILYSPTKIFLDEPNFFHLWKLQRVHILGFGDYFKPDHPKLPCFDSSPANKTQLTLFIVEASVYPFTNCFHNATLKSFSFETINGPGGVRYELTETKESKTRKYSRGRITLG